MRKLEQDGGLYLAVSEAEANLLIARLCTADDYSSRLDAAPIIAHIRSQIRNTKAGYSFFVPPYAQGLDPKETVLLAFHQPDAKRLVADAARGIGDQPVEVEVPAPAKGEWTSFNINGIVRVKLTEIGLTEFRLQRERINACMPNHGRRLPTTPTLDSEGYYTTSMWSLMQDFGHLCIHGFKVPFETTILLDTGDLNT